MIRYKPRSSPIHSLDPRIKLAYLLSLSLVLIFKRELALPLLALTLSAYLLSRISPLEPVREFGWFSLLFLIPIPLHALIQPGTPILAFWGMDLTREGLVFGLQNFTYLLSLFMLALLFTYTTEPRKITQALCSLGVPKKIAFMLGISLRFVSIVQAELNTIRGAQASRAYKKYNPFALAVPLLHKSFRRAKALSISMDSRAFDPERIRIAVDLELRKRDYLSIVLLLAILWISFIG